MSETLFTVREYRGARLMGEKQFPTREAAEACIKRCRAWQDLRNREALAEWERRQQAFLGDEDGAEVAPELEPAVLRRRWEIVGD